LRERAELVVGVVDALKAMGSEIAEELAWQMGRPIRYGQGELSGLEERARHMAAIAEEALAPLRPKDARPGFERMIAREPVGLVFTIAPWNYPYLTTVNSLVPALIAGNAVILKQAAQTLLVGDRFQEAFDRIGLPKGLMTHLVLEHAQTEAIIAGGHVDHVAFTGSVEGGRAMARAAAGAFTTLGLELGGKDPAYVSPDANLNFAVENLVDGAFFNSGQCCCGIERIYVHEARYDAFLEAFVALTSQYVLDNPLEEKTTLGPMARANLAEVVRRQTRAAIAKGARPHLDPASFAMDKPGGPYLGPQVLTEVDHTMDVMREESFGPVVGIMKVKDEAEAIALMNDSPYGLTASVWTENVEEARRIGAEIETGTIYMNRCDYLDPGLAWTGVKNTGYGASLSALGYGALTRPKSYHLRLSTTG
jgi:acyl-CoA reductase-like NAD-dependent aldehyde dehydrogenase